ncbi:MAG: hypothetical protein FJ290_30880, partial [Planctomycetes bacterium]|nr:hypothetical protein [Planctomycetota bacterium]
MRAGINLRERGVSSEKAAIPPLPRGEGRGEGALLAAADAEGTLTRPPVAGDLSPRERWVVAVWIVLLVAGGIARAAELQEKAGGALSLQVVGGASLPREKGITAAFGPAPVRQTAGEAVWKAGDILNNAQGAVSFRIRIPKQDKPPQQPFSLMSLSGTQAGEWTLSVNEAPEPKGKAKPSEQAAEPDEAMKLDEK